MRVLLWLFPIIALSRLRRPCIWWTCSDSPSGHIIMDDANLSFWCIFLSSVSFPPPLLSSTFQSFWDTSFIYFCKFVIWSWAVLFCSFLLLWTRIFLSLFLNMLLSSIFPSFLVAFMFKFWSDEVFTEFSCIFVDHLVAQVKALKLHLYFLIF